MKKRFMIIAVITISLLFFSLLSIFLLNSKDTNYIETTQLLADDNFDYHSAYSLMTYASLIEKFAQGIITYEDCIDYFEENLAHLIDTPSVTKMTKALEEIALSKSYYEKASYYYEDGSFLKALSAYTQVSDVKNYLSSQYKIDQILEILVAESDVLASSYFYEEAIVKLEEIAKYIPLSTKLHDKINEYRNLADSLVLYDGDIQHIFFHSLIVYPELAFDGDHMTLGYNYWMATVDEFKRTLEELYERNFILIDIRMLYEEQVIDGKRTIVKKDLYLPPGKKPLILSLDDLNYYEYMHYDGFADRLVLDANQNVATLTYSPDGDIIIARDNDCVPILDVFVEKHPGFSYQNAKGIIALTGYEGILGYRTDMPDSDTYEEDKQQVLEVIKRLKETGWLFASHSQGHIDCNKVSYERLVRDTNRWAREVGSLVGHTDIYIYPFGSTLAVDDKKLAYLHESGFNIFCGVGVHPYLEYFDNVVFMNRRNIDGFRMHFHPHYLDDLMDVYYVMDKNRPNLWE